MTNLQYQYTLVAATCILSSTKLVQAQMGPYGGGPGNGDDDDWGNHCNWWGGDCDDSDSNGSGNGNNSGQSNYLAGDLEHYNRIITIHAVLACLVWVFLIPLGGILIRSGLKSPWVLRIHALLQSISFLIYIVAAGCGVYLVRTLSGGPYSMWEDPHVKLGLAILALAFFQPILGIVHHLIYKKRAATAKSGSTSKPPGRTLPGYAHLWVGRVLLVLGMINGGLGLRLASLSRYETNTKAKTVAYGVGAAVMGLLYFAFIVFGERRRAVERKNNDQSAVPLVTRDVTATPPPTYHQPPSYEASQDSLIKQGQTTARYS